MRKTYRRCCGMDVHKEIVVVCVLPPDGEQGKPIQKVYGTLGMAEFRRTQDISAP